MSGRRNGIGSSRAGKTTITKSRKLERATILICEALEVRRLFATVSWITQGNGDYSDGANWSTGTVPQPGDNVIIDVPGIDVIVTYSGSSPLQLGNLTNTEVLEIDTSATWNSGTLDGSGDIDVLGSLAIGGSANKILKDGQSIDNVGSVTLSGTGNIVGQVGASIVNGGMFDIQSDADITFPSGVGDGIFENYGTVMKSGGGTAPGDSTQIGGAQGFTFEDSLNNTADAADDTPGICLVQQGTLQLGDNQNTALTVGGSFQISSGATLDFSLGSANITVLKPTSGPQVIPSITGDANGAGTLEVSGATVQMYGTVTVHEIDVSGGALLLQQNMQDIAGTPQNNSVPPTISATADIVSLSGGTLGGNGGGIFPISQANNLNENTPAGTVNEELPALVIGTSFSWTGGGFSGAGRVVINSNVSSSTISDDNDKFIDGGFGLDLLAPTVWTGSGTIDMNGSSVLFIHGTGSLEDEANGTITQGTVDAGGGSVWNVGIILKEGGTGVTTFGPGINVINNFSQDNYVTAAVPYLDLLELAPILPSKIDIRTGTVSLQGTSTNENQILIHPGATLSYDGGSHLNQTYINSNDVVDASILGVDGGGAVNFGAATFISDSQSLTDVPTVTFSTGTYSFDNTAAGAQRFNTGTFNGGSTGTISGNGTLEFINSFAWNSGSFLGVGSTTSTLLIDSGALLTLEDGNYNTLNDYSIDNDGTLEWTTSPGTLTINGNYVQASTGTFDAELVGTAIDGLAVSGTVTLAGTLNLSESGVTLTGGEVFTLVNNTGSAAVNGTFNGYPEGAIFKIGSDTYKISYVGGDGNDVTLTGIVTPTVTIITPSVIVRPLSGVTALIFTVKLSVATGTNVTVNYSTSPGTAKAGTDYLTTDGTLTIAAGQTTGAISVPILGTTAVLPAETFTVTLSDPTNANLGTPASAVGTIVAQNGPPVLSFFTSGYTVDEDAGEATIVVVSSNSTIASTVNYSTVNGTAIAGVDFTAVSGTLVFSVGVSRLTFNVPITDEGLTSGQKVFTLVLSNPVGNGATLGLASAAVGILDNDGPKPTLSIDNVTVTELIYGQTDAVFDVTLSAPYTSTVSVNYTTVAGSAPEGKFVPQSGTLTFNPGVTDEPISVPVNSDFVQDATETFNVVLSDPVNVALANTTGIGTIFTQNLTVVPISAGNSFHYIDALDRRATISLSGPGSGVITYLGLASDDGKEIVLNGTTAASTLTVTTDGGQTAVVNLIVNGSIKAINAPVLSIIGNVTITGAVAKLSLYSLLGGNTVTIGTGAGIPAVAASFHTVTDASLISSIPLASLKVYDWQNAGSGTGISAPSAVTITSSHDFDSDISLSGDLRTMAIAGNLIGSNIRVSGTLTTLTAGTITSGADIVVDGNLGKVAVRGVLDHSSFEVGGSITSLTAGKITNSDIFASTLDTVTTLPTDSSAFADSSSTIFKVAVTSHAAGAFANSLIAAPIIGNVSLSTITVLNNGTTFGVAANSIKSVTGKGTRAIKQTQATLAASPFSDFDLSIALT